MVARLNRPACRRPGCGRLAQVNRRTGGDRCRGLCIGCYRNPVIRSATPKLPCGPKATRVVAHLGRSCRHCGTRPANRARGLCYGCYNNPSVRDRYPPGSSGHHCGRVSPFVGNRQRPLPPEPTTTLPGTTERADVYLERLEAGYHLHHPGDLRL